MIEPSWCCGCEENVDAPLVEGAGDLQVGHLRFCRFRVGVTAQGAPGARTSLKIATRLLPLLLLQVFSRRAARTEKKLTKSFDNIDLRLPRRSLGAAFTALSAASLSFFAASISFSRSSIAANAAASEPFLALLRRCFLPFHKKKHVVVSV